MVPPVGTAVFVGRRLELDAARLARRRAVSGDKQLLLVTGEPGIGKTRLTAEIAQECDAAGDLVLHGRWDEEPLCPYQAFREALGRYALRVPEDLVRADVGDLGPGAGPHRARGARATTPSCPPDAPTPRATATEVFEAVNRWVRAVAQRRRLVLVLDDMHWADRPSLLLLEYLLRSTTPTPMLIVATYRQTDTNVTEWFSESLAGIRRTTAVENIALSGLSAAETRELLEAAIGRTLSDHEATGVANLQRHTGGNPFFLQEVVRDLREAGRSLEAWSVANAEELFLPERMRDVVRWRLRQLTDVCMRVLSAASALGEDFDIGTVGDAIECDEETLLAALDEARLAGVIVESSREFDTHRFTHAVVRQALYHDLGVSRRTRLHRQLGKSLEARYGVDAHRHAAELARHFYLGASAGGSRMPCGTSGRGRGRRRPGGVRGRGRPSRPGPRARVGLPVQRDLVRCLLLLAIGKACVQAGAPVRPTTASSRLRAGAACDRATCSPKPPSDSAACSRPGRARRPGARAARDRPGRAARATARPAPWSSAVSPSGDISIDPGAAPSARRRCRGHGATTG